MTFVVQHMPGKSFFLLINYIWEHVGCRDTFSRPPCTLVQPPMEDIADDSRHIPDFGMDWRTNYRRKYICWNYSYSRNRFIFLRVISYTSKELLSTNSSIGRLSMEIKWGCAAYKSVFSSVQAFANSTIICFSNSYWMSTFNGIHLFLYVCTGKNILVFFL